MAIRVISARGSRKTAALLQGMLEGVEGNATVSYGVRIGAGERVLNAAAGGGNKYEELERLHRNAVSVPRHCLADVYGSGSISLPLLARRFNHRGGSDIRLCGTPQAVRFWSQRRDFFTQYIENDREFRVWVYRNSHLGTYEKILRYPSKQRRAVGRNYKNGYSFELVRKEEVPREAVELGVRAIAAMGWDFGAVDIIHGRDGVWYVLECNSAPGVEGDGRQCIQLLAKHIRTWVAKGCKGRKKTDE